jgi:hypothetical protein
VTRGKVRLSGQELAAGDGAGISAEPTLALGAIEPADVVLFDLG